MQKEMTLYPFADTYVDSTMPYDNFSGKEFYLLGCFRQDAVYRILMQFSLAEVPPEAVIEKAVLRLYCVRNDCMETKNGFVICPVKEAWERGRVSFDVQPPCSCVGLPLQTECAVYESVSAEITPLARVWHERPDSNHGILLRAADEQEEERLTAFLSTRQSCPDWRPCLELTLQLPESSPSADEKKRVALLTSRFLERDGARCLPDGRVRYLRDLARLLAGLGWQVDIFQPSNGLYWKKEYDGFRVFGIGEGGFDEDFFLSLNKSFYSLAQDYDLHLYFGMDLLYPYVFENAICVSQGIWWDAEKAPWWRSQEWYGRLFTGLNRVKTLVSTDTNTLHWLNAVHPSMVCRRIYLPNYVDLTMFHPTDAAEKSEKLTVLYPRRLVYSKGWGAVKEAAKALLQKREDLLFSFVGRGTEQAEQQMMLLAERESGIVYHWYPMEKMATAYQAADLVLLPSRYAESTSFSLLEAMACGKPVLAGNVGGLTDLVIDGFNGVLLSAEKDALEQAIVRLADDWELRLEMGKHAVQTAQCFSKKIWERRWKELLLAHRQTIE